MVGGRWGIQWGCVPGGGRGDGMSQAEAEAAAVRAGCGTAAERVCGGESERLSKS